VLHRLLILFWAAFPAGALAQSVVLSIESGSAAPGETVAVAINIASTTSVAAVEWSFSYSGDIVGLSVVPGNSAQGAQKSVVCTGTTCLAYGRNTTSMTNGTLAVATFRLASKAPGPAIPIRIVGVSAASPAAAPIPASGGSGLITVLPLRSVQPLPRCCRTSATARALETAPGPRAKANIRPVRAPIPPIPAIADGGIVNAASLTADVGNEGQPRVAVGSLVSIFGANLGTAADSVRVTFNGVSAPLVFVSDAQINAQVPLELLKPGVESTTASVVVTVEGKSSAPRLVRIVGSAPGVFSLPAGAGNAMLHSVADGALAAPSAMSAICGCSTRAIHPGEPAVLYVTGLGSLIPPVAPVVLIGGTIAPVTFFNQAPRHLAGYRGVEQINILVPANAPVGDRIPLQVQVAGTTSSNQVTVAIAAGP